MKEILSLIIFSCLIIFKCCKGENKIQLKTLNKVNDKKTLQKDTINIKLSSIDNINKSIQQTFILGEKIELINLSKSPLMEGENFSMLDEIFNLKSVKSGAYYKADIGLINIYDIFYEKDTEKVFNNIIEISKTKYNIPPYFDFFKRGTVILLDKRRNKITYILYNATKPLVVSQVKKKIKNIKGYDRKEIIL